MSDYRIAKGNEAMAELTYEEFLQRKEIWDGLGSHLMSRDEVALFDALFANKEESGQYQNAGFIRALAGDFSQYETVEPIVKGYLGAKKCYELYDRFQGNASDPRLQQEIKARLMEVDLRTGFAMGSKDPNDPVSVFLKECERIANRQMLMQTLEDPNPTAKLRLRNQFERENPATAQQKMDTALNNDRSIASEAKELKAGGLNTFAPARHRGMNASVGGLGQVGPNGKVIASDGTNGHMYMHLVGGSKNTCGMMLVGFENAGPGQKGRLGHTHDASAKKAGSSAFLSDKSYLGREMGGRVVDLSGLSGDELSSLLVQFEAGYRNAAMEAQAGNTGLLNACNDLLTGKLMSVGQMKGMLQSLNVREEQIGSVEQARAGHYRAAGYEPIFAEITIFLKS